MEEAQTFTQMLPLNSYLQWKKYRIERFISSGGFGNTYEVTNMEFEERMALKEFFMKGINERDENSTTVSVSNNLNQATFDSQMEKFKKEARRLRKLNNPHIVQVHDMFEENGTAYYVMDYIDGESLAARLKRTKKPLSEAEALGFLHQVLDALESVHSQGIWHLDLKPGNIMVDKSGLLKLIDFGASKQMKTSDGSNATSSVICHTPGYAPTEQIEQNLNLLGPWTDLYALGGTLYNLLTCNQPPTISEMLEDDAFKYPQKVSEKTKYLIRWMMTPLRQKRPQSVADVKLFLEKDFVPPVQKPESRYSEETSLGGNPPNPSNPSKPSKPKPDPKSTTNGISKKTIVSGLAGAVLLIGIIVFFFTKGSGDGKPTSPGPKPTFDSIVSNLPYQIGKSKCSYSGRVDEDSIPHGIGEATFTGGGYDGGYYKGPFVHGKMNGESAFFRFKNGDTFEGTFVDNNISEGKYMSVKYDSAYFIGTFKRIGEGEWTPNEDGKWYNKNGELL